MTFSWARAANTLRKLAAAEAGRAREEQRLDEGQRASIAWMADRLPHGGLVLADEVGTGKTRIACAVVHAVLEAGGRAAVVVPHGLMHQWVAESRMLLADGPAPRQLTTLMEFLRDDSSNDAPWEESCPRPDESEWWLISHGFRTPAVRRNSYHWRTALPALVDLHLASPAERGDGRTRVGKLQRGIDRARASSWVWAGMMGIASQVAPRVRGLRDLRTRIATLSPLDALNWNNEALLAHFADDGEGRLVTEELLGRWLGDFDLLVIDEAHKSRGEVDVEGTAVGTASGTVLARLVNVLLKQPEGGRRLCLTATPMELSLLQWLDLLERARSGLDPDRGRQVVQRLHDAAHRAAIAPDEGSHIDELCAAAREFTRALSPHVTRRRRDDDPLVNRFRERASLRVGLPHPHRRLECVPIACVGTADQTSPWLDVLFAAECMSRSARGLTVKDTADWPRAVRDAYTRLSAGHVSLDLSETSEPFRVPDPGAVDDHTRGKIARVAYWYRRLRDGRRRVLAGSPSAHGLASDPDAEHPRIVAAVREIEAWTSQREKVLVFGVFLRPLRLLRDVLNVRHALRAADSGRPVAHAVHSDEALLGIVYRQLDRLRAEGHLTGRLSVGSGAQARLALADSHRSYERLREKVRRRAKRPVAAWNADPTLLGGSGIDRELRGAIEDHLVSFVLDDSLATTSASDEVTGGRFDALATEFAEERLRPLLGESGCEDDDETQAALRRDALRALVEDDDHRQSLHARLLQGATRWETRRYLQAAFNRAGASPRVLIAQSQVGREGLNLHESCRVVVQFHAEWNPAVLEQQIGRVDRKGSLWESRARSWLDGGARVEAPFIEVRQLVLEGTYDAYQWERVTRRQRSFDASLFGSLLPADAWDRVPDHRRAELLDAAPSFEPPRRG